MIVIACIDDKGGMMFNHRRQSRDRMVPENIAGEVKEKVLWMSEYSAEQFKGEVYNIKIKADDEFLIKASQGEYCFVEDAKLSGFTHRIEYLILYFWNRNYPADEYLDIDLADGNWEMVKVDEFIGHSHEKITKKIYVSKAYDGERHEEN